MPAVFVHGVPDTPRVWNAVVSHLERRDVVRLSLPGFACPMPGGFPATKESYVDWLLSRLWQTPEVGERVMEAMTPEALRRALVAAGVAEADAAESAGLVDATMERCILALYRSAVRVGEEWEPDLSQIAARGLVLWGENDPYAAARFGARLAERTGARFVSFPGCSHWWQLERAEAVAGEFERLWAAAP
jgi:pimeloyl-ACP methyl ester carboxylesterase